MVLTIEDQSDKTNENDRFIVLQDSREQRNASEATVTLVSVRVVLYMSCQMRSSKSDVNESSATSTVSSRTEQHSQTRRGDRLGAVFFTTTYNSGRRMGRRCGGARVTSFHPRLGLRQVAHGGGVLVYVLGPTL